MAEVTLTELAEAYEQAAARLRTTAERIPGAFVIRNQVGNLGIIRPDDGSYVGFVDVLTGEVWLSDSAGEGLADG